MGGDERQTPRQTPRDDEVVMTTEVIVQREEREDDGMSMGGKSSAESTIGTSKGHHYESEGLSKSSSELHLATRGF
jgi:hypothetical protein